MLWVFYSFSTLLFHEQGVSFGSLHHKEQSNDPHIGGRRNSEHGLQLTDFDAAFTAFTVLLTQRVILTFDLNLYIPFESVDANMQRAPRSKCVCEESSSFRRHGAEEVMEFCGVKVRLHVSRAANGASRLTEILFRTVEIRIIPRQAVKR
jgi:hypothetical protein